MSRISITFKRKGRVITVEYWNLCVISPEITTEGAREFNMTFLLVILIRGPSCQITSNN